MNRTFTSRIDESLLKFSAKMCSAKLSLANTPQGTSHVFVVTHLKIVKRES